MARRPPRAQLLEPRLREHEFFICVPCAELFQEGPPTALPQRCPCRQLRDEPRWPGYDFNRDAELCACCARDLVASGSRWMHLLCGECMHRVRALNARLGAPAIPVGIHSFVNGVFLPANTALAATAGSPEAAAEVKALGSLFDRINRLTQWRRTALRGNLESLVLSKKEVIPLPSYLSLIRADRSGASSKEAAFDRLCRAFGVSPRRRQRPPK